MYMKKIIFACTQNSGRSKIAEAVFNSLAEQNNLDWKAESAGIIVTRDKILPNVATILENNELKSFETNPTKIEHEQLNSYDKIISFGCVVKSKLTDEERAKFEEWYAEDPRGASEVRTTKIYEDIKKKVEELIARL